jgi:Rrf2 family iron-sulfur cluster assembly transcriptional regulator
MKVTTRSSYTVRALLDLAQHSLDGRPVRLSDISEREGISHAYLEQLFNRLKKVKVVRGRKGPGGGSVLAREAAGILMGEVIRAVEGEEKLFLCTEEHQPDTGCRRYPQCMTHVLWERLSARVHEYLNSISLADMLKEIESLEE